MGVPSLTSGVGIFWIVGVPSLTSPASLVPSLAGLWVSPASKPHVWLSDVLMRLPTTLDRDIEALLPHRWQPKL